MIFPTFSTIIALHYFLDLTYALTNEPYCGFPTAGHPLTGKICSESAVSSGACAQRRYFTSLPCFWEGERCTSHADLTGEDFTCTNVSDQELCEQYRFNGARYCVWYKATVNPTISPSAQSNAPSTDFPTIVPSSYPVISPSRFPTIIASVVPTVPGDTSRATVPPTTEEPILIPSSVPSSNTPSLGPLPYSVAPAPAQSPSTLVPSFDYQTIGVCGYPSELNPWSMTRVCSAVASTEESCNSQVRFVQKYCRWSQDDGSCIGGSMCVDRIANEQVCTSQLYGIIENCKWYTITVEQHLNPSVPPSLPPSLVPFALLSVSPSLNLSVSPSTLSSALPSILPFTSPSLNPTASPSMLPSASPFTSSSLPPNASPSAQATISVDEDEHFRYCGHTENSQSPFEIPLKYCAHVESKEMCVTTLRYIATSCMWTEQDRCKSKEPDELYFDPCISRTTANTCPGTPFASRRCVWYDSWSHINPTTSGPSLSPSIRAQTIFPTVIPTYDGEKQLDTIVHPTMHIMHPSLRPSSEASTMGLREAQGPNSEFAGNEAGDLADEETGSNIIGMCLFIGLSASGVVVGVLLIKKLCGSSDVVELPADHDQSTSTTNIQSGVTEQDNPVIGEKQNYDEDLEQLFFSLQSEN